MADETNTIGTSNGRHTTKIIALIVDIILCLAAVSASAYLIIANVDGLIVDLDAKSVKIDGTPVELTKLEFELLLVFLQNKGKLFSREDLLIKVWPSDALVTDRTVDVNITRLRKKIGQYGKFVKTKVGYGYYFENISQ